jgi:hypothetical protein
MKNSGSDGVSNSLYRDSFKFEIDTHREIEVEEVS